MKAKYIGPMRPGVDASEAGFRVYMPWNVVVDAVDFPDLTGLIANGLLTDSAVYVAADSEASSYVPTVQPKKRSVLAIDHVLHEHDPDTGVDAPLLVVDEADLPGAIAAAISDGAAAAVASAAAGLEILTAKSVPQDDIVFCVTDPQNKRSWVEITAAGGLSQNSKDQITNAIKTAMVSYTQAQIGFIDGSSAVGAVMFAVTDAQGRRSWLEVGPDGGPPQRVKDLFTAASLAANPPRVVDASDARVTGIAFAVVDDIGHRSDLEIGADGHLTDRVIALLRGRLGTGPASVGRAELKAELVPAVNGLVPEIVGGKLYVVNLTTGGTRKLITATGSPSAPSISGDGLSILWTSGGVLMGAKADGTGTPAPFASDLSVICCNGDSLTDGNPGVDPGNIWPVKLDALLPNQSCFNNGQSGRTADEIGLRQGGTPLNVTVAGASIPASGAVICTIVGAIYFHPSRSQSVVGLLNGVPGTMNHASGQAMNEITFTRTTPGTSVATAGTQAFASDLGTTYRGKAHIFFEGRNDEYVSDAAYSPSAPVVARVVESIKRQVAYMTGYNGRFLVFGTTTSTGEVAGTSGYNIVTAVNAALKAEFPNNYYDLRKYMVEQCIYDLGITPTTDDLTKMSADTVPTSIMAPADTLHFDDPAANQIAIKAYEQLLLRGWVI